MGAARVVMLLLSAAAAVGHMHAGDEANETLPLSETAANAAVARLKMLHEFTEGHLAIALTLLFDNCKGQVDNFTEACKDVAEEDCNFMVCKDDQKSDDNCEAPNVYSSRRRSCYDPTVPNETACTAQNSGGESWPYQYEELQPESMCCNGEGGKECKFDAMGEEYSYPCCPWCWYPEWNETCTIEGYIGIALLGTTQGTCYGCVAGNRRLTEGDQSSCTNKGSCTDPGEEWCEEPGCCSLANFTQAVWTTNTSALSREQCEETNYCAVCSGCPHPAGKEHDCVTCGVCSGGSSSSSTDEGDCTTNGGNFTPATWSLVYAASEDACRDDMSGEWLNLQHYEDGDALDDRSLNTHMSPFKVGPTHKEPEHILPTDCVDPTMFLADAAAGMTAQAAFDANPQYYEERIYRGSIKRAVLSNNESATERSKMTFSEFKYPLCWVGLWEPTNKGEVVFESTSRTYAMVLNPLNLAGGEPLSFTGAGDVVVLGGTNAGTIDLASTGKVEVYGVENSGPILATGSQDIIIANVTNRAGGTIIATGVTAGSLIDVINEGEVRASGNFTAYNIVNMGNVTILSGSIDLYLSCPNTGVVEIWEGVTGSVTYHEGCKGTLTTPSTVQEFMIADPATTTNTSTTTTTVTNTTTMTNTTLTLTDTTVTMTSTTVTSTDTTTATSTTSMTTTVTTATATSTTSMTTTITTDTTMTVTATTVTATTVTATTVTITTTGAPANADGSPRADITAAALFVISSAALLLWPQN